MKRWKQVVFALVIMVVMFSATRNICASELYEKITNTNEWEVLKIVNKERQAQGLEPLTIFASLQSAAGVRAKEIADHFSHYRPDGTMCYTVIREQEIAYGCAGENIAAGYATPANVMNGWMNSAGHRENILSDSYSHIGVGYYKGGDYGKKVMKKEISLADASKLVQEINIAYGVDEEIVQENTQGGMKR